MLRTKGSNAKASTAGSAAETGELAPAGETGENTGVEEPASARTRAERLHRAEAIEDRRRVLQAVDVVLGAITIGITVLGAIDALVGATRLSTVLWLASLPLINLVLSQLSNRYNRNLIEIARPLISLPPSILVYLTPEGPFAHLWIPAVAMVVGCGTTWGVRSRRPLAGLAVTALYSGALGVSGLIAFPELAWITLRQVTTVGLIGGVLSTVAAGLGESLALSRDRRREVEAHKHRLESALALLTTAQAKLDAVLDCAPGLILVVDAGGRIDFVNRVEPGEHKEKVVGSHWLTRLPTNDARAMETALASVISTGSSRTVEVNVHPTDGRSLWYSVRIGALHGGEQITGAVVIAQEVTELRRTQAEYAVAQRMAAVGTLASGIAHEINTPVQFVGDSLAFVKEAADDLFGVIETLDALRGLALREKEGSELYSVAAAADRRVEEADLAYLKVNVPQALTRCVDGLGRVATIVRSMKEFAHPAQKEMHPIDINRAIETTLTIARNEYKYVAELETDFGELPLVTCHGSDVNQVILNLVVNAAHAIGDAVAGSQQKGWIRVRTRREGADAVVSITDTGKGIPENVRSRIFEPFFTTKEVGRGTGQGLALAWSIVNEKHGGTIDFESRVGEGTTFYVRLPIAGRTRATRPPQAA